MVKDIIREIKDKWFQFIAIAIITMLGVGFYIGIQVTGYDMRKTGDQYMEEAVALDFEIRHSLGLDEDFIEDLKLGTDAHVYGVYDVDSFVSSQKFDDVAKIINYDENTKKDIRLIEGELPTQAGDTLVDNVMKDLYGLKLGDELVLEDNDVFEKQSLRISGFVESSLFLNLERGQSRLGSGSVQGFIYPYQIPLKQDSYTSARLVFSEDFDSDEIIHKIESLEVDLSQKRFNRLVAPEIAKLEANQEELDKEKLQFDYDIRQAENQLQMSQRSLDDARAELENSLLEINPEITYDDLEKALADSERLVKEKETQFERKIKKEQEKILKLPETEDKAALLEKLETEKAAFTLEVQVLNQGLASIKDGIRTYESGLKDLKTSQNILINRKAEGQAELANAQASIDQAYQDIYESDHGRLYLFSREDVLIGYREFYQDSDRIEAIGQVFPLIFFAVAVLVTLSTISRMIDESRMQIGVYKALGYSSIYSAMKYVSFSFFAWLLGVIFGLLLGFYLLPSLIYNAYRIMYQTPELKSGIVLSYAVIPLIVSFLSSVGVAFIKSISVSRLRTAELLRPAMPKGGQHIFLEAFPSLWNRLSFFYKVSFRNLFRNKTRFLMTLAGIGGSFGLLITGFGLKHSIYSIVDKQFDELIQYDGLVVYNEGFSLDKDLFDDQINFNSKSVKVSDHDANLYSFEALDQVDDFIKIKDREKSESFEFNSDSVLVSEKLAIIYDLSEGDLLTFRYNERDYNLEVSHIFENYVYHYIYISQEKHEEIFEKPASNNMSFFKKDMFEEGELSEKLYKNEDVLSVSFLGDTKETYKDMMGNFDIVIYVIILAAFSLELIVLVNLITMNLSERYKEMATLKVLGFYPQELALYLLRENVILTLISLFFGAIFGKYLHRFVIVNAEIDVLMFNRELLGSSYVFGALLTFVISLLVNLLMAQKANKVNMGEALKTFDD